MNDDRADGCLWILAAVMLVWTIIVIVLTLLF